MIDHVNTLGRCSNAVADLTFAWCDGSPIINLDSLDDDLYDSNYVPSDDNDDNLSYLSNGDLTAAGVDDDNNNDNDNANNNDDNDNANHNNNNDDNDNANHNNNNDDINDGNNENDNNSENDNDDNNDNESKTQQERK